MKNNSKQSLLEGAKICSRCQERKSLDDFGVDKHQGDGHNTRCKNCRKAMELAPERQEYMRQYRARPENIAKQQERRRSPEYREAERAHKNAQYRISTVRKTKLEYAAEYAKRHPKRILIQSAKIRAKKKGVPFGLKESDFDIPEVCPIFGVPFEAGSKVQHPNSATLDRIDPEKGYVSGNINVISWRANRLKSDGNARDHFLIAEYILRSTAYELSV